MWPAGFVQSDALRASKEAFVTGHAGSTPLDVLMTVSVYPAAILLHRLVCAFRNAGWGPGGGSPTASRPSVVTDVILELAILVLPPSP